ncbi:hypothetical protein PYW07_001655 [Mythimna separata]|uniref:Peptidase S1 domain-containing protein n=1 Tax=Mythimna separata TaxID=271217 RepID=A0AAD8DWZ8_MYTSE|nr:hypothetical protein PYW07_001655 [Mythimna separata]
MGGSILLIFCMLTSVWQVNSVALKGPVLTRYDPCGLGLIQFDRFSENYWRLLVNFGLYPNMVEAELGLVFKNEVTVYSYPSAYNFTVRRTNKHDLIGHGVRPIPARYIFYVSTDNLKANESDVPIVNHLTLNNVTLCNDKIKRALTITGLNVTQRYPTKPYAHVCGRRSINHTELVSVRTEAQAGDWPWHVAILVKDRHNVSNYNCGGNIVSRTAILTAGHCVHKNGITTEANRIVIVAGTNNHKDLNQRGRQTRTAQKIILHPAYNADLSTSDLAIIKVNRLEFTDYVQPICIWGPVYNKTFLYGKEATVVGFGGTEHNKVSDVLRSTYTMIQNDTTCINFSRPMYSRLLNEFTFCAGYGPSSTINPRNGDSGGGLVMSTIQPDHMISWFLRGVLSKCGRSPEQTECDPSYYVVYTDVAPQYGWIYHHSGLEFRNNVMVS